MTMQEIKNKIAKVWCRVFNRKTITLYIIVIVLVLVGVYQVNKFFQTKELVFKSPIVVNVQAPITVEDRKVSDAIIQIIEVANNIPLTENEIYLCKVFGDQCKTALEIQRRENVKGDCDSFYVNNNKSVDFGFMQVNSVHLSKDITMEQLIDCKSNIDIAYQIYKKSGWNAWTTYAKVK